ncbi:MAG: sigma-70 family RNA polymerase sigma factor [Myxococcota bacterium]
MDSDEALMQRVQRGDEAAFEALFHRYRSRLYGFLLRRVGEAPADDLFQETWLRVVRYRDRFDPRRRFSTWLFQIANNLARDLGRRSAVRSRARGELILQAERGEPDARRVGESLDQRLDVRRRVDSLPERLREVLLLRYYHQMAERDIARIVGIPPGTVKSRLHTAIRRLREEETEDAS